VLIANTVKAVPDALIALEARGGRIMLCGAR